MNRRGDEYGEVLDIISKATKFMRVYLGEVLDDQDELGRGRIKVSVPDLGWFRPTESPWVEPEYGRAGHTTPKVGSFVVVYFMAGDVSRPIYRGPVGEVKDSKPSSYSSPKDSVLFEDGDLVIKYNRDDGKLTIIGAKEVDINGDSKAFVTHAELDAALQSFISTLNSHTHAVTSAPGMTAVPNSPMSIDISGAKTDTVRTGG